MKYRVFPKTGEKISLLGFGTMRLPVLDGDFAKIDEEKAIAMIRSSINQGVNYVDTAYMYHDGNSEVVTGKALKDGYREKVLLADKMPVWFAKDPEGVARIFDEQLERLDTDVIDMYLLHNITAPIWKRVLEFDTINFLKEKQAEGKIKHLGFSFHGDLPLFKEVIDAFPWDFCQIQLNYMDMNEQAGVEGLKYAESKNIPVIVMEPLKGGKLTDILPDSVEEFWKSAPVKRTPAEWALRWVADFPGVMTILSGMHTLEQVDENLRILSEADPNSLSAVEQEIISNVSAEYNKLIPYSCTGCKYCLPCPNKIDIPTIIDYRNEWSLFGGSAKTKADFKMWVAPKRYPSTCVKCGICEERCPQGLHIIKALEESAEIFE